MVVQLKPHTLQRITYPEGSYNELYEWVEGGEPTIGEAYPCDAVKESGKASSPSNGEAKNTEYSYVVYLSADYPYDFSVGDKVLFTWKGCEAQEYIVKGYTPYQHQKKLWIGI